MSIRIPVQEDFVLDGGMVTSAFDERWQRDVYTITPPAQTMFDQIRTYLLAQPSVPHSVGFQTRIFGIGLVALTMRWGSYLAALM
ncbi:MAG: hypothetical protein IAE80_22530, partial [Anaerolinea sp.]|nr:hypothetical protein [Anaerolinea sp.]